ncbi:MAG: hypothetical protein LBE33_06515 [Zoogloeaceae bacterium]|nr:hypothetical protein [Zoogloeaceae bacterium]
MNATSAGMLEAGNDHGRTATIQFFNVVSFFIANLKFVDVVAAPDFIGIRFAGGSGHSKPCVKPCVKPFPRHCTGLSQRKA